MVSTEKDRDYMTPKLCQMYKKILYL